MDSSNAMVLTRGKKLLMMIGICTRSLSLQYFLQILMTNHSVAGPKFGLDGRPWMFWQLLSERSRNGDNVVESLSNVRPGHLPHCLPEAAKSPSRLFRWK